MTRKMYNVNFEWKALEKLLLLSQMSSAILGLESNFFFYLIESMDPYLLFVC